MRKAWIGVTVGMVLILLTYGVLSRRLPFGLWQNQELETYVEEPTDFKPWENDIVGFDQTITSSGLNLLTFLSSDRVWVYDTGGKQWQQHGIPIASWIQQAAWTKPTLVGGQSPFNTPLVGFDRVYVAGNGTHQLTLMSRDRYWIYDVTSQKWTNSGWLRNWMTHANWQKAPTVGGETPWSGNLVAIDRAYNPNEGAGAHQLITLVTRDAFWVYDATQNAWKNSGLIADWFSGDAARDNAWRNVSGPKPWEGGVLRGFSRMFYGNGQQDMIFVGNETYWVFRVETGVWRHGAIKDRVADYSWKALPAPSITTIPPDAGGTSASVTSVVAPVCSPDDCRNANCVINTALGTVGTHAYPADSIRAGKLPNTGFIISRGNVMKDTMPTLMQNGYKQGQFGSLEHREYLQAAALYAKRGLVAIMYDEPLVRMTKKLGMSGADAKKQAVKQLNQVRSVVKPINPQFMVGTLDVVPFVPGDPQPKYAQILQEAGAKLDLVGVYAYGGSSWRTQSGRDQTLAYLNALKNRYGVKTAMWMHREDFEAARYLVGKVDLVVFTDVTGTWSEKRFVDYSQSLESFLATNPWKICSSIAPEAP